MTCIAKAKANARRRGAAQALAQMPARASQLAWAFLFGECTRRFIIFRKIIFSDIRTFFENWIGINNGSRTLSGDASAAAIGAALKLFHRDMRQNIRA
jgi:hypothetical protein